MIRQTRSRPSPLCYLWFFFLNLFLTTAHTRNLYTVYIKVYFLKTGTSTPYDTISRYRLYSIAWKRAIHRHLECNLKKYIFILYEKQGYTHH